MKPSNYLEQFGSSYSFKSNKNQTRIDNSILTPSQYGEMNVRQEKIDARMEGKSVSSILGKKSTTSLTQRCAFTDLIMNQDYEDTAGKIDFGSIVARIKQEYEIIGKKFQALTGGLLDKNHSCLEYHLFTDGYMEFDTTPHIVLFSSVNKKQTIESEILTYPYSAPSAGVVLTMITQLASQLKTLIFETTLFGDEANTQPPLLPRIPGLHLSDIWNFGMFYFKLNVCFPFEDENHPFLSKKVRESLQSARKKGESLSLQEFYNYNLHSLGMLAIRYLRPLSTNCASLSEDITETKKYLSSTFMNEFRNEAKLLGNLIELLVNFPDEHTKFPQGFDIQKWIDDNTEYQETNPINSLLRMSLEKSAPFQTRLEKIRETINNRNVPRGLELKLIDEFIKGTKPISLSSKTEFISSVNDTENEDEKTAQTRPFLQVQYPLDVRDYCNISSNITNQKIFCEVTALFKKDFYVYRVYSSQCVLSIEFSDDLTYVLSCLPQKYDYISAELDQERRVVIRSTLNLQGFENELEAHLSVMDTGVLFLVLLIQKLNFCIENEEFGRMIRSSSLTHEEFHYHMQNYLQKTAQLTQKLQS